jgi:hypothetical protein
MRRSSDARKAQQLLYSGSDEDDDETSSRLSGPSVNVLDNKYGGESRALEAPAAASGVGQEETAGSRSILGDSEKHPVAGYHSIGTLDASVNLPEYVREHNTTLTFPEKVS